MPQMPKHRKAKRATVLAKRTYLKKHYKERSYRPLYEKLKNNNNYLAKALSQEKQNCQSLFSQNIALIAEVQELRLACNTRNNVMSNVVDNAKEILKMIVTMSGYITNTISMCQEFTASDTNLSSVSAGRKESSRRLSTKSPAKGVVKPMVSGHTITKPTINLSRVNMQNINNPSRLSDIQEVTTPNRSQEMNEIRSPIAVSIPITQLRYENRRTCRMPERLVVSPRVNSMTAGDEQILRRRRSRHSKKLSGSYSRSKSSRWSGETVQDNGTGRVNQLGSPRVKLNDVSKLLRNSQSINIRTLINNRVYDIESQESSDDAPHDTSDRNIVIPETQMSINLDEEDETYAQTPKRNSNAQTSLEKSPDKDINGYKNISGNSRLSDDANMEEDPLEGPSWLFNDTLTMPSQDEQTSDRLNISNGSNCTPQSNSKLKGYSDESSDIEEDIEEELSPLQNLTKCITDIQIEKRDYHVADMRDGSSLGEDVANDSYCTMLPTISTSDRERNFDDAENNGRTNFAGYVTMRRGHSQNVDEEETEDFTLLLSRRRPMRDMHFDINELRLPVLEGSMIDSATANEIDTEVTTAIQRITNIQIPSVSNQSINESSLDPTTTIKLPLILGNDQERVSTPEKSKYLNQKDKNARTLDSRESTSNHIESVATTKSKAKRKKKLKNNRDPSAAKVVLEKLNEYRVKPRTPSPDDTRSRSNSCTREIMSNQEENSLNTMQEIHNSENDNDNSGANRPRRRKAPVNLREPNLNKKLRRNW